MSSDAKWDEYLLFPEYPTATQVREFVSEQIGELFGRVFADRHMLSGDMSYDMDLRYHEAVNAVASTLVEWIEANDVGYQNTIDIWGMEP